MKLNGNKIPWSFIPIFNVFLHFYRKQKKIDANGSDNLVDTMYSNRENLEAIFRMMDLDSNGLISIDEFKQACELLSGKFWRITSLDSRLECFLSKHLKNRISYAAFRLFTELQRGSNA
jgi:Ca2+-binding EF-hand superfamily protein